MRYAHHNYLKHPHSAVVPWQMPALFKKYGFPTGLPGGGEIAIIELGGGWVQSDVDQAFSNDGLPSPTIVDVSVAGGSNNGDPTDPASGEVALDIQVAGKAYAFMTGQPAKIFMYWAPNTLNGIAQAIAAASADGRDVCSISWGSDEMNWGRTAALYLESVAMAARAKGMLIFAASGDNDSSDGGPTPANVDLPAAAPHVIGCGGTTKTMTTEVVWNANPGNPNGEGTGAGPSTIFPRPWWQAHAPSPVPAAGFQGRLVPDVVANADPATGYHVILGGQDQVFGGTSAVAPLYAGFFAAFGPKLMAPTPTVTPTLWAHPGAFNKITIGNNGMWPASVCGGLGSPRGVSLASIFVK
jgi:kumamolisin